MFQRENNVHTINRNLQELAVQVGAADHAAFRHLYATLAPQTLAAVRGELPDVIQSMHVVRATFCEVWWMCAFDARCGSTRHDIPMWVAAIAHRRAGERRQALALIDKDASAVGQAAFWSGLMADYDQWTQFELAVMLDGHDGIPPPATPGLC